MRLKFLFSILFVFQLNFLFSQDFSLLGLPEIKYYSFEDYKAGPQNWSIGQDGNGRMYFGNNHGLLRFDGVNWELYPLENRSILRSLDIDSAGNVFVGGEGEFGFFSPSADGTLKYTKLSSDTIDVYFVDVWSTYAYNDTVYFFAGKSNIFYYHQGLLKRVENDIEFSNFRGFKTKSGIYAIDANHGLAKIVNAKLQNTNQLKDASKYEIYTYLEKNPNTSLAVSSLNGLYIRENQKNWIQKNTFFDDYLIENHPYHAIQLNDGNMLISTLLGGVVFINANFNQASILNKAQGLHANGIYKAFQDKQNNIWLATENGIEYIHYSSPIRKLGDKNGLDGSLNAAIFYRNKLYLGTYGGVYYLDIDELKKNLFQNNAIKLLSNEYFFGLDFGLIKLGNSDTVLLGSTLRSIIRITENEITTVESFYGAEDIEQSNIYPQYFGVAHGEGINLFKINYDGSKIENIGKLFGFNYNVRKILFDNHGYIWAQTAREGLALIEILDYEKLEFRSYFFDETHGLPDKIKNTPIIIDTSLVISTNNGLYDIVLDKENLQNTKFKTSRKFGFDFARDSLVFDFAFMHENKVWGHANNSFFYKETDNLIYKEPFFAITDVAEETTLSFLENKIVAIGSHNMLYFFNEKKDKSYEFYFTPLLNKIKINGDFYPIEPSVGGLEIKYVAKNTYSFVQKLSSNQNNLSFYFAVPYFEYSEKIAYSYQLEGYDNKWSEFSSDNVARYTNLGAGDYIFKVKARNVYTHQSQELLFLFAIRSPWYLSAYSIFAFTSLLLILIYVIIRLNSVRLINQNKKLEEIVKNRTLEIYQQKEEIQSQTEQLKSQSELLKLSNIELRQLSLVAKGTSNSVLILDDRGNIEWWNSGFTKLFKYKFMKYQGSNFNKIKSKIRPDLEESINEIKQTRLPKVYTIQDEISPGEYLWFQTSVTPVFEEDGTVFRYIVIDSDITQIKIAESEINNQKHQLEKQRDKIAHHNKEMTSSIEYASRIQQAMLPLPIFLEAIFSDFFVLNLPRDIVSGDFYWASRIKNRTYMALGDCTGHGIPGAFLSLLGISFLNNIIQRNDDLLLSPAEILNQLRERFIVSLHQRGKNGESQDGMDISLVMIDQESSILEFAGANNPFYFFKENSSLLQELKADKMPIGIHANDHLPFTNHTISVRKNDIIYLFTDGYRDQFGGNEGKKFMTMRFKKLLTSVKDLELNKQKQILTEIFMEWKMGFDQVDDILIFGIKL